MHYTTLTHTHTHTHTLEHTEPAIHALHNSLHSHGRLREVPRERKVIKKTIRMHVRDSKHKCRLTCDAFFNNFSKHFAELSFVIANALRDDMYVYNIYIIYFI